LRAKAANHSFQPSEATSKLNLVLDRRAWIVSIAAAVGNTTRDGKSTLGFVPGAWSARMASITTHFAPAAVGAAPYLQGFCAITTGFWRLIRHHVGRRNGIELSRMSFCCGLNTYGKTCELRGWRTAGARACEAMAHLGLGFGLRSH